MRKTKHSLCLILAALCGISLIFIAAGTAAAQTTAHSMPAIPAHASVTSAIPAIGSTVSQAPTSVTVFTAENINPDPKVSNLFVYGPAGEATDKLISQGNAQVSLANPKEMSIKITPSPQHLNGVYVVHWITKSADDGDPDEGAFTFTVNTGAAVATPATTPVTSTGQGATSNSNSSGGAPIWLVVILALVALLIGLGAGLGVGRRNPARPAGTAAVSGGSLGAMRQSIKQEQKE